ncbi:MAG: gliding motility-associated C-terminal domain-containing protein [Bacteroidota bacterium]
MNNNQVFEVTLENEWGCIATASIAVRVRIVEDGIYIPNAFSPNGDQFNDYFTVYADEQVAEVLKLQVFDRWGGLRHQSVRFLPNEARSGWDGTAAGEPLASGVYVYQLWLRMANGRTVFRTGDVTLLR